MEKHAIRAYGASRDLFALAESCRFFFKIGGAAGRNEIGTIAILCRGLDGFVLHGGDMVCLVGLLIHSMSVMAKKHTSTFLASSSPSWKYSCIRRRCRPVART